ncbi:MAG: hypothetical protein DSZ04_06950 [Sulfurimonas sp.]|nr:MAG: hypothetical protein DSZ04_06950 [Sulfurimonas sp.]
MVIGVLQDISGPKIRIGDIKEDFSLKENDTLILSSTKVLGKQLSHKTYQVSINYPEILKQLNVVNKFMRRGLKEGSIKKENSYILTAGDPIGKAGSTNMIRVISSEAIKEFT